MWPVVKCMNGVKGKPPLFDVFSADVRFALQWMHLRMFGACPVRLLLQISFRCVHSCVSRIRDVLMLGLVFQMPRAMQHNPPQLSFTRHLVACVCVLTSFLDRSQL